MGYAFGYMAALRGIMAANAQMKAEGRTERNASDDQLARETEQKAWDEENKKQTTPTGVPYWMTVAKSMGPDFGL